MKTSLLLAPWIMLVAGCSGTSANNAGNAVNQGANAATTNAAASEPVSTTRVAPGAGAMMRPGQWEMTTQLVGVEIPGAPPEAAAKVRSQLGGEQKKLQCVTEEELSTFAERLASGQAEGLDCDFSRNTFGGGTIDIAGTCRDADATVALTMNGVHTADTLQLNATVNMSGAQNVRTSITMSGRRVGDCPG